MKSLVKPTYDIETVYSDCVSIVQNVNLKARLTAANNLIIEAAAELDGKVSTGEVYTIIRETIVNLNLSAKELEDVYKRMVRKETPGRIFYNKLFISAPLGICPYCSHRIVTQLDHYLPKALYPRLSVVPFNLIPSCSDCNKAKLSDYPTNSDEEFLHPYYDNIENDIWLTASIEHSNPPVFHFSVNSPAHWSNLLKNRVQNYFNSLELNSLYSTQAAVQLTNIKYRLNKVYSTGGAAAVREFLTEEADSRIDANLNSWQSAMYISMVNDDWLCNGGFGLNLT